MSIYFSGKQDFDANSLVQLLWAAMKRGFFFIFSKLLLYFNKGLSALLLA
ncbi:hypothetical protein SAMD00020551_3177 [Mesobacillus selenatarsenatis SF-1]|uniref:Uncharacterized protein n=1 Tax=Mesobacillus selenatarsenatis (strain DSM 18680 / JCM 14380 / FERM P-15431 / SF-1) TaxID=1321606 RepID=A0A0A8XA43_MESS1|nr:hypothetical protein SAMD00020551_3177 [Mesobacillus selenatarsenatis SF-1]